MDRAPYSEEMEIYINCPIVRNCLNAPNFGVAIFLLKVAIGDSFFLRRGGVGVKFSGGHFVGGKILTVTSF